MRLIVLGAIAASLLATPAMANQCPTLWVQLNAKMTRVHLSSIVMEQLTVLRQEADKLHHTGKHAEAEALLNKALSLFSA